MKNSDIVLYSLLVESGSLSKENFTSLNEDEKMDALRMVASSLLKSITSSLRGLDTTLIDRSRGEIRMLPQLDDISTALRQLETLYERNGGYPSVLVKEYHDLIKTSLMGLSRHAKEYKNAYRMKQTVMIAQYQAVVTAVASAVAYLFSSLVDFTNGATLKTDARILPTTAYKIMKKYAADEANGSLRVMFGDVVKTESFYHEVDETTISTILEANDIISVVIDGLSNMYNNLDNGGKLTNILYKSAGVIVILVAVKEMFAMIERSKFTIQNIFDGIKNFAHMAQLPSLNKLAQFGSKFKVDSEANSELASRDTEDIKNDVVQELKTAPTKIMDFAPAQAAPAPASGDDFFF